MLRTSLTSFTTLLLALLATGVVTVRAGRVSMPFWSHSSGGCSVAVPVPIPIDGTCWGRKSGEPGGEINGKNLSSLNVVPSDGHTSFTAYFYISANCTGALAGQVGPCPVATCCPLNMTLLDTYKVGGFSANGDDVPSPSPPSGKGSGGFPMWAIIVTAAGGGALVLVVAAVLISFGVLSYSRRRSYDYLATST